MAFVRLLFALICIVSILIAPQTVHAKHHKDHSHKKSKYRQAPIKVARPLTCGTFKWPGESPKQPTSPPRPAPGPGPSQGQFPTQRPIQNPFPSPNPNVTSNVTSTVPSNVPPRPGPSPSDKPNLSVLSSPMPQPSPFPVLNPEPWPRPIETIPTRPPMPAKRSHIPKVRSIDDSESLHDGPKSANRISGGARVALRQFPSYVKIKVRLIGDVYAEHYCSGTLISEDQIITAAHCVDQKIHSIEVNAGLVEDIYNSPENLQQRQVYHRCLHDKFRRRQGLGSVPGAHDVAILVPDKPFNFTQFVQPACVSYDNFEADKYYAAGFGDTELIKFSHYMHYAELQKLPCKYKYKPESNTCYKNAKEFSGICIGDTGGGLIAIRDGRQHVVGVASTYEQPKKNDCSTGKNTGIHYLDFAKEAAEVKNLIEYCRSAESGLEPNLKS